MPATTATRTHRRASSTTSQQPAAHSSSPASARKGRKPSSATSSALAASAATGRARAGAAGAKAIATGGAAARSARSSSSTGWSASISRASSSVPSRWLRRVASSCGTSGHQLAGRAASQSSARAVRRRSRRGRPEASSQRTGSSGESAWRRSDPSARPRKVRQTTLTGPPSEPATKRKRLHRVRLVRSRQLVPSSPRWAGSKSTRHQLVSTRASPRPPIARRSCRRLHASDPQSQEPARRTPPKRSGTAAATTRRRPKTSRPITRAACRQNGSGSRPKVSAGLPPADSSRPRRSFIRRL